MQSCIIQCNVQLMKRCLLGIGQSPPDYVAEAYWGGSRKHFPMEDAYIISNSVLFGIQKALDPKPPALTSCLLIPDV